MEEIFARTQRLIGAGNLQKLAGCTVAVFGVGGVGSFAAEALCRSGVGRLILVDHDTIAPSNINRQIHADTTTVGQAKVEVMARRMALINPDAQVVTRQVFCLPDNVDELLPVPCDYIIDAVDTVTAKLCLAEEANRRDIPIISCMGAGNKLDPTRFQVADVYETSVCPLCRIMRRELRKRNIPRLKVVYSTEMPVPMPSGNGAPYSRPVPGSIAFVPSVAGLIAAGHVVLDLIGDSLLP